MSSYLFGNIYKSVGAVNGIPVTVKTEIGTITANKTTVRIGNKELAFNSRQDALDYLRNMGKSGRGNKDG